MMNFNVSVGTVSRTISVTSLDEIDATIASLHAEGASGDVKVTPCKPPTVLAVVDSVTSVEATADMSGNVGTAPAFSTFAHTIVDDQAATRINAQHETLKQILGASAQGLGDVAGGTQFFATGTRMMADGYATQNRRAIEHAQNLPIGQAADEMSATVTAEKRRDVTLTGREIARGLTADGTVKINGFRVTEQAIRGIMTRTESPALTYLLGLRDRLAACCALPKADRNLEAEKADRAKIAEILAHELNRMGADTRYKLRTREAVGDIFAAVGPDYAPADAPMVLATIVRDLPSDTRATWSYDPLTTAWELRASVWTPTPSDVQAVGEPFEGFASYQSRDNGTSSLRGGGGINVLRCLNASVYVVAGERMRRVHRGNIVLDVGDLTAKATRAIHALCAAWGTARTQEVALPIVDDRPIPLEEAIPGFWRHLLKSRDSELALVLKGRTEANVEALTRSFHDERRDADRLVKADFAQGWTKAIQSQPTPVRRDAEVAIASWMARASAMPRYEARA